MQHTEGGLDLSNIMKVGGACARKSGCGLCNKLNVDGACATN